MKVEYKYSVFTTSAIFAGIAGGLYACYISYIDPGSFDLLKSVMILIMVILGGMGNIKVISSKNLSRFNVTSANKYSGEFRYRLLLLSKNQSI